MDNLGREAKWNMIFADLVIKAIPYDYVRKIIVHHNNLAYVVHNEEEFEEAIKTIVKTGTVTLETLQTIKFEIIFNTRKFKKEIKNRVETLFSKYFVV